MDRFRLQTRRQHDLWKVSPKGGRLESVLVGAGEDTDPEFAQDGRRLLYTNTRASFVLVVQDAATRRDLTQVTRGQEHNSLPHWSADGAAIYYYQERPPHTSFRKISLRAGKDSEVVKGWTWETQNGARVDPSGMRIIYSKLDRDVVAQTMIMRSRARTRRRLRYRCGIRSGLRTHGTSPA
jgi:Tol biopolymer transport system component